MDAHSNSTLLRQSRLKKLRSTLTHRRIRVGTVGYHYRDWAGVVYPPNTTARRQLALYAQNFDVCELTQFTHQMPEIDRMTHFASQIKSDIQFLVRVHQSLTHSGDLGMALTVARHFRKALDPLHAAGRLAALVASFPYAFKFGVEAKDYLAQLAYSLHCDGRPLQLDFRHPSWATPAAYQWMAENQLGFVCVDEPQLPGLMPAAVVSTTNQVVVRFHGRNAEGWWSGNPATRFDYGYTESELDELWMRYEPLLQSPHDIYFLFHNHWQAQSFLNARQWKDRIDAFIAQQKYEIKTHEAARRHQLAQENLPFTDLSGEDEQSRPPTALSLAEIKSRVSRALSPESTGVGAVGSESQVALELVTCHE